MKHIADRLEIAQGNNNTDELIPEAIAMLRHQQAEIEDLKAKLQLHDAMDNQCASLMQQSEIEALKSKLNKYHLKEDLERNLKLIYGKEIIK